MYNYLLLQHVREKILEFTVKHNHTLSDIVFECDADCRGFVQNNGLHHGDKDYAYILSDLVAWGNNRGREPDGVISVDVTDAIETKLRHDFK